MPLSPFSGLSLQSVCFVAMCCAGAGAGTRRRRSVAQRFEPRVRRITGKAIWASVWP
jgi:hypothetical protein